MDLALCYRKTLGLSLVSRRCSGCSEACLQGERTASSMGSRWDHEASNLYGLKVRDR
jgi:hypothetical protein